MNAKLSIVQAAAVTAAISVGLTLAASGATPAFGNDCLRQGREAYTYSQSVPIPDGSRAGVLIGPLPTEGEGTLEDLVVRIEIRHPATGDLDLRLCYDRNNDGVPDAAAPLEFHLARGNACAAPEPFAVPVALDGEYYFRDGGPGYSEPIFSAFCGLDRGGRFYLAAADSMAQEAGSVVDWSVYLMKPRAEAVDPAAVESAVGLAGLPQ